MALFLPITAVEQRGLQTELRSTLLKAGEQTKSEQKLLQNRQYRHLLDMHELLRVTGPDKVKAVFSKSAQDAAFIKTFLHSGSVMSTFLADMHQLFTRHFLWMKS